jgi:hypothetical protein
MNLAIRLARMLSLTLVAFACISCGAQSRGTDIQSAQLIQPADLAKQLQSGAKLLMIQVGSRVLYNEAHIPSSEYIGPTASEEGRQKLRDRVKTLPKDAAIVLYCGCCPWSHCPNVKPAYAELHAMGFTNLKVLYIANNFGADWVERGYPVARGDGGK